MKSTIKIFLLCFALFGQSILFGSSAAGSAAGMPALEPLKSQPLGVKAINHEQLVQLVSTKIKLLVEFKTTALGGFTDDQFVRALKMIGENKLQVFIGILNDYFKPTKQTPEQKAVFTLFKELLKTNLPVQWISYFQQFLMQFTPQALNQLPDETLILLYDSLYSIEKALQQIQIADRKIAADLQANQARQILQMLTNQMLNMANQQRQQLHLPVSHPQFVQQPVAGTLPQAKAPLQQNWMLQPPQQFWTAPAAPFVPQQFVAAKQTTPLTASTGLAPQENVSALQEKQLLIPVKAIPTASAAPAQPPQAQGRVLQPSQRQLTNNARNQEETKQSVAAATENSKPSGMSAAAESAQRVTQSASANSAPLTKEDVAKVEAVFAQLFRASQDTIPNFIKELKDQVRNIAYPSDEQKKAFDTLKNQAIQQVIDFENQVREFQKLVVDNPKIAKMTSPLSPSPYEGWAEAEGGFDHDLTEFKHELTNLALNPQETRDQIGKLLEHISLLMPYFVCDTQYKKMIPFLGQPVPIEFIARRSAQGFHRVAELINSLDTMDEKVIAQQTSIDALKVLNRFEGYFNPATNVYKYIQGRIPADKMLEIQTLLERARKYLVNRAQQQ